MRRLALLLACFASTAASAQTPKKGALPVGTKVERDLAYGDHEREKLDVYLPAKAEKPLPLIVWIHGGGWEAGSKEGVPGVNELLKQGYAVAAINYRYSQQAPFPAQIEDCKAAIRYLRGNAAKYNFDKDHVGVFGASAGGHLVALLGTSGNAKDLEGKVGNFPKESSKVQAVVDWFGPTDLVKLAPPSNAASNPVTKLLGGMPSDKAALYKSADPITFASKESAPFLILHGDKDPIVPVEQSRLLDAALTKAGAECELIVVPGAGHDGKIITPATTKKMDEFFEKHLKKGK